MSDNRDFKFRWKLTIVWSDEREPNSVSYHPNRENAEANASLTWDDYGSGVRSITLTLED